VAKKITKFSIFLEGLKNSVIIRYEDEEELLEKLRRELEKL
jgi:hypothetical protein